MKGGVLLPPNPKIRYRGPVAHSAGFHTSTAFHIVTAPAEISPKTTWNSTMLPKGTLDLGGYLRPFRPNERGYCSPPIQKSAIGTQSLLVLDFIHRPLFKLLLPQRKFLPNRPGEALCFRKALWIRGAIYAHSDQMKGGIASPPIQKSDIGIQSPIALNSTGY